MTMTTMDLLGLPGVYPLPIYRGAALRILIQFTDDDEVPLDISGTTWEAQIRLHPDATEVVGTLTVSIDDEENAILALEMAAEDTAALPSTPSKMAWDLYETVGERYWLKGPVTVDKNVTRGA